MRQIAARRANPGHHRAKGCDAHHCRVRSRLNLVVLRLGRARQIDGPAGYNVNFIQTITGRVSLDFRDQGSQGG